MSVPARALFLAVRVYQAFFSALMPSACKFYPSCSHYAADALRIHGARRGSWLALRRIARCHPFTRGGVDLVPDSGELEHTSHTASLADSSDFASGRAENPQTEVCANRTGGCVTHEVRL